MYGGSEMKNLIDSYADRHITYLCDSGVTLVLPSMSKPIKIWGSPFTPSIRYFNTTTGRGHGPALRARVDQIRPEIHIFGHLHDDGGKTLFAKA